MLLIAVIAASAIGRGPAAVPMHLSSAPIVLVPAVSRPITSVPAARPVAEQPSTQNAPDAKKSKPKPDLLQQRPQAQCRVSGNQAGVGIFYLYGEIEPGPALACAPPPANVALPPPLPF